MLWDCEHCGCQGIAASLEFCPVCGKAKPDPNEGNVPASEVLAEAGGSAGEAGAPESAASPDPVDAETDEDAPSQTDNSDKPQQQASNTGW